MFNNFAGFENGRNERDEARLGSVVNFYYSLWTHVYDGNDEDILKRFRSWLHQFKIETVELAHCQALCDDESDFLEYYAATVEFNMERFLANNKTN